MNMLFDIGLIVVGSIAKYFIGENWVVSTAASKGLENLIDRGKNALKNTPRKDVEEIRKVSDRITKSILPLVKAEYGKGEYSPVFLEFANTISRVEITSNLLVELDFDSDSLYKHIKNVALTKKSVQARYSFSRKEENLYNDLLRSFCKEMVRIATVLNDFEITVSQKQLKNQRKILTILSRLYERPSQEDKEFEERYCRELAKQLDKLEMFGIRRVDDVARQQSLTIAYTTLEVEQKIDDYTNDELSKYHSSKSYDISTKLY